jgi:hypothetical protein
MGLDSFKIKNGKLAGHGKDANGEFNLEGTVDK